MKQLLLVTGMSLALCAPGLNRARGADEGFAMRIVQARQANAAMMKGYSWNTRAELLEKDKVMDTRIELVTYGPNGQLQSTLVNDQQAPLPRGFLRKRIAEKDRERVEKYLGGLHKLLDQYTLPTAGKILDFVTSAQIQAPGADGLLLLTGSGAVVPGDSVSMWVEAVSRATRKLQITTTFNGEQVTATATFITLKSGLTHLAFAEVEVVGKDLKLQIHNFDYNSNN